jgi:hypothetical protein
LGNPAERVCIAQNDDHLPSTLPIATAPGRLEIPQNILDCRTQFVLSLEIE